MSDGSTAQLKRISDYVYEIPISAKPGMRVPGRVFVSPELLEKALLDRAIEQVENVAFLPGIVEASMAMPDIHWGYGFPIGGVAAVDAKSGVVSPGGVGFDINCGVRLLRSSLTWKELGPNFTGLMDELGKMIPKGVGEKGRIRLSEREVKEVLKRGAPWAVEQGFGVPEDLEFAEENGSMAGADPEKVSHRAYERAQPQLGSLGAGNHFLEVQEVAEIFDAGAADAFGLFAGQVVVMIHSGSRGLGHQVCTDYLRKMDEAARRAGIDLPDRQLACAPIDSPEARDYLSAMAAAVNYAFANRHCLAHWARKSFENVLKATQSELNLALVYDVTHNIAKFEVHEVAGRSQELLVHRKGATRAFGPGHPSLPSRYQESGQPVMIPGDMGTGSFVLAGTQGAMEQTFGTTCHGAGRLLSRSQAKREIRGKDLRAQLEASGIQIRAGNLGLLAEEAPAAYKDVASVVEVCVGAGISSKVARLRPLGVVKG